MTPQDWKDLVTMQEVAQAQSDGWEIEICADDIDGWLPWIGKAWCEWKLYCGRPKQPKTCTVTSECWWHKRTEKLTWGNWIDKKQYLTEDWQRFPAGDITGEVAE